MDAITGAKDRRRLLAPSKQDHPPAGFGKKPLGRLSRREQEWTTLDPDDIVRRRCQQATFPRRKYGVPVDTRRFELPIAVAIIPRSVINRRLCTACEVRIRGTGHRKDALRAIPSCTGRPGAATKASEKSRYLLTSSRVTIIRIIYRQRRDGNYGGK